MTVLSTPETTEVLYGVDKIISKTIEALSKVKDCLEGCYDSAGPSVLISTEPVWKAVRPAELRIREIEEGLEPEFIKMISNASEIQKLTFDLVTSAKR